jgi:phenylpropionate dioxygenase-like ring-hydroxylating dioxygenase large terminal subunit
MQQLHYSQSVLARWRDLAASRQPGYSLPQELYTDEALFACDMQHIIRQSWLLAGHVGQIRNPGDYVTLEVGQDTLIIIRGADHQIYAHHNVCRHRGSRLLTDPRGHVQKLVCPYHAWAYQLDGGLAACMHMPSDFDRANHGLWPVHLQITEGLIYINLAETPPDFSPFAADLNYFMGRFDLASSQIAFQSSYDVAANWKLLCENFSECYHCGPAHPEYTAKVLYAAATAHPRSLSATHVQAIESSARNHFEQHGLGIGGREQDWYYASRQAMQPGFVSMSADGQLMAPLMGSLEDQDAGNFCFFTRPNGICEASSDHVVLIQFLPLAARRTRANVFWLVDGEAVAGRDYDLAALTWFWTTTAEQDWEICTNNQAGVDSPAYRPGPYSLVEGGVNRFVEWYLARVSATVAESRL